MKVLAISYAKQALLNGSREQKRMLEYAQALDSYVLVVLTRTTDMLPSVYKKGNLIIYGTTAKTRIGMFFKAIFIGRRVTKHGQTPWVVSSQDPFICGLISRIIVAGTRHYHHIQVHGDLFSPNVPKTFFQTLWNAYALFMMKRTKCIRVVSQRLRRVLVQQGIADSQISVLPINPHLESFYAVGRDRSYEQKDSILFLYVGRLSAEKNITRIIKSFATAYKEYPKIQLRIVGEGPARDQIESQVSSLGIKSAVQLIPWKEDVVSEMEEADVLVMASLFEGYGLVLVEAMAAGLPTITTDVGCVGEMLLDDVHGIVVPHERDGSLVRAILRLARDRELRAKYGERAYQDSITHKKELQQYIREWTESFHCNR